MKKCKIGLVGCGAIAQSQAAALKKIETADFCAVCDLKEELARDLAQRYQVQNVYTDYAEMLGSGIDAVIICTPNFAHCENAVQAAKARKHILVQKPFAMSLEEADRMIEAAKENGVILQAAFFERFYSHFVKVRELLQSGAVGRPLVIRTQFSHTGIDKFWFPKTDWFHDKTKSGGGPVGDLGSHHFDLIRYVTGSEVKQVTASTQQMLETGEIEDNASVTLTLQNGVMAQLFLSFTTVGPKGFCYESMEVYGEKGSILCRARQGLPPQIVVAYKNSDDFEEIPYESKDAWADMESHFIDCVLHQKQPITTGEDGKICLSIIKKSYQSAETGMAVPL